MIVGLGKGGRGVNLGVFGWKEGRRRDVEGRGFYLWLEMEVRLG